MPMRRCLRGEAFHAGQASARLGIAGGGGDAGGRLLQRRELIAGSLALSGAAALGGAAQAQWADPIFGLYPAKPNAAFTLDREVTAERFAADFNNFCEFGSSKSVAAARDLKSRPWTVAVDGLVERPLELALDDLIRRMPLEERLYHHRCVEAWAMAVPWTGFPLRALLALARPLGSARYVKFTSFQNPDVEPGQRQTWYPWPYTEGLTLQEAGHDLAFLVTGVYGKPLSNPFGAPLRLAVPWKYGFKSAKSLVRITLQEERPRSFWEALQPSEYGFWANVNPGVHHPRWSQASERMLGTDENRPTLMFNGYAAEVSHLYAGIEKESLYF